MPATEFTAAESQALDESPLWPRLLVFPAAYAGFAMLLFQWPTGHWAAQCLIAIATAYCLLCWTSCLHETAHQTLCSTRWVNIVLGKVLGTTMLVPYTVYRETHIRHHAYLNKPADWELWPYSDPQAPLWFRRVFVWCDLVFGWLVNPCVYGRIFFHRDSPIASPDIRRVIRREYRAIVITWTVLIGGGVWLLAIHRPAGLGWWWLVPIPLSGMLQSARKLTEHLGMRSYDPMLGTRSVAGEGWITHLCTWLNFDIFVHGPHHRHPKVAHHLLRETLRDCETDNREIAWPVFATYRTAIWDMLPWMWRNPGVGINVGAPPVSRTHIEDCQNFVEDVNRDILTPEEVGR
ncbi:MAG: fatty acid desaturase [Planctomycetaceae bacterium]